VVSTIIKPRPGLQPKRGWPVTEAKLGLQPLRPAMRATPTGGAATSPRPPSRKVARPSARRGKARMTNIIDYGASWAVARPMRPRGWRHHQAELGLQAKSPASRTRTPTPERSEWGTIFPGLLVEQSASKMSGPTNPPRGCREGRKAAPCTLRGERNRHRKLGKNKSKQELRESPVLPLSQQQAAWTQSETEQPEEQS